MNIEWALIAIVGTVGLMLGIAAGYTICALCASSKISDLQEIIQEQQKEITRLRYPSGDFAVDCIPRFTDIEQADPYTPEEQEAALSNISDLFDQVAKQEEQP